MPPEPPEHFRHFAACPRCAVPASHGARTVPFTCASCGFVLYFNAAAAVAVFIHDARGRVLFIRRAREPSAGTLGLPGGFVDFGETAEEALRREVKEEVGLELGALTYLASGPNRYAYSGVTYETLDLYFTSAAAEGSDPRPLDAVHSLCWLDPASVDASALAFESLRRALATLIREGRTFSSSSLSGLRPADAGSVGGDPAGH